MRATTADSRIDAMTLGFSSVRPTYKGPEGQEDMPYLLTPGPLTTMRSVKLAMLADWGSRDPEFRDIVRAIRNELKRLVHAGPEAECVLMQGSGTFAIEAALGCFAPGRGRKTLVLVNGNYGERAAQILEHIKRPYTRIDGSDSTPTPVDEVAAALDGDPDIQLVFLVHCETTSGIVNPLIDIARAVKSRGRVLMVDAMSSFGALPIDMAGDKIDVLVSSSNKCIEGVPGFAYAICRRDLLVASAGRCHSVALDLHAQWTALEQTGQFRFTPPTHTLVAFAQALRELADEGGIEGRLKRYRANQATLVQGMKRIGFVPLLEEPHAGPIIQTFLSPHDPRFEFEIFYRYLRSRGFAIYPGKLTKRPSFRIGTIGQVDEKVMRDVLQAVRDALKHMGVKDLRPAE
jgi:2-aminoethylphosphonate-pyruvate transaminase